jgi:predicted alpha/beta-hydrolase family hydrolase
VSKLKETKPVTVEIDDKRHVSGLLVRPETAIACYVLAHGAGAGMTHPFMEKIAHALATEGIATLRFQFHYMEQGSKRPDAPKLAQATVRAAVEKAGELLPGLPLIAGGKSFGGRMTSQAQAASPLPNVKGLAFLGFPLHAIGKPSDERAVHLAEIKIPMLFLQGTRDALAEPKRMRALAKKLGKRATLIFLEDADHSWHVRASSGGTDADTMAQALEALAAWVRTVI